MGRTNSEINDLKRRVAFLEKENGNRVREIKDSKSQIDLLTDSRIIEMLQETSPYNHKPRYSYDEISIATGRSTGYISNKAKDAGLQRKHIKPV
ncbi:hypothetical protein M5X11_23945 [Paenibacillus alginolyticus]|uniref:hypothetical protein n=1 Tax=Paenibacillus alginolyticus TaxID=59839 RepID=UPI0004082F95|nr:hypothetical protein [Paenibacillus alginolyticus]MCY9667937.1 hypothetical protein [Paenibacillus alginolyticus]